jgi:hypothetical protein
MKEPLPARPMRSPPDATSPTEVLEALLAQTRDVLQAIRTCHQQLARAPVPEGPHEAELQRLHARRAQLSGELGPALLRLLAVGGNVAVQPHRGVSLPSPALPAPEPPSAQNEPPPPLEAREPAAPFSSGALSGPEPERTPASRVPGATKAQDALDPGPSPAPALERPRSPSAPPTPRPQDLGDWLQTLQPPAAVETPQEVRQLLERLGVVAQQLDEWLAFPPEVQQGLMGLVSALARHLQDELPLSLVAPVREALLGLFPELTRWSRRYRPGFVPGLSRQFGPAYGSWLEDATWWWEQLLAQQDPLPARGGVRGISAPRPASVREVACARPPQDPTLPGLPPSGERAAHAALAALEHAVKDPEAELGPLLQQALDAGVGQRHPRLLLALRGQAHRLAAVPGLKTLKSALKSASRPDPVAEDGTDEGDLDRVPDDWPPLALTEGKHAVIVGGDPRPEAAERVRLAFRLARVDWDDKDTRRQAALAERVRSRSMDLVLLLRGYVGHAEASTVLDACKRAGVPFVVVDTGYGVSQVRRALERFGRSLSEEGRAEGTPATGGSAPT